MAADIESLVEKAKMLGQVSFADVLPRVRCPVWFVATTLFKGRDPATIRALAARTPRGRYLEIPTGHLVSIESPDMVDDVVLRFLGNKPAQ